MTPFRPDGNGNTKEELKRGAMDVRALAMDAAMRIGTDASSAAPAPAPTPNYSSKSLEDFNRRWPGAARIGVA
jgi:hypothetical protein